MKKIAIGSDHAGFELKEIMIDYLTEKGFIVENKGCFSLDSVDYPDFVHPTAEAVENKEVDFGIVICGSANGVSMTANKHQNIRAAIAWIPEIAKLAKEHNNANILSLPARYISSDMAKEIVDAYINAEFEGGRHQKRVSKIALNIKNFILVILASLLTLNSFSQEISSVKVKPFSILDLGAEFQFHSTGTTASYRAETNLTNNSALNFKVGINLIDQKDFLKLAKTNELHIESGFGYGLSIGYKQFFSNSIEKFYFGIGSDVWFNNVEWTKGNPLSNDFQNDYTSVTSKILVVQPTVKTGWLFELGENKNVFISPEIALGYEWNAKTIGEQKNNGFILLGGISGGYRFNKK